MKLLKTPFSGNLVSALESQLIDAGLIVIHSPDADLRQGHRRPTHILVLRSDVSSHERCCIVLAHQIKVASKKLRTVPFRARLVVT